MNVKKQIGIVLVMAAAGLLITGCKKSAQDSGEGGTGAQITAVKLCSHCGEIKGSDKCCAADAVRCDKCGMIKDSPACCKGIDFSQGDVELCQKCGQVKGSEKCCVPNAEKCPKCGLAKGSPGCCNMPKTM